MTFSFCSKHPLLPSAMSNCYCCKLALVGAGSGLLAYRKAPSDEWIAGSMLTNSGCEPPAFSFQLVDEGGPRVSILLFFFSHYFIFLIVSLLCQNAGCNYFALEVT